jgi:hypothetical protein
VQRAGGATGWNPRPGVLTNQVRPAGPETDPRAFPGYHHGPDMRRLIHRPLAAAVAAVVLLTAAACGSSSTTKATTATAAASTTTETFTGTISAANGHTYPFVSAVGTITLTLTSVLPDSGVALGISLGTWSGSACTVGTGLFNDTATQGTVITGQASSIASLCARVYDGAGQIAVPTTYVITVVHP